HSCCMSGRGAAPLAGTADSGAAALRSGNAVCLDLLVQRAARNIETHRCLCDLAVRFLQYAFYVLALDLLQREVGALTAHGLCGRCLEAQVTARYDAVIA